MAEIEKKKAVVYVVAPVTTVKDKDIGHRHVGGNLHITKNAKIDPTKLSENEKKGLIYFKGEKIPTDIKADVLGQWIKEGNVITEDEYKEILDKETKETVKKKEAETKRR